MKREDDGRGTEEGYRALRRQQVIRKCRGTPVPSGLLW